MSKKRFTAEQIIAKLLEAEVGLSQGQTVGQVCRKLGASEHLAQSSGAFTDSS